MRLEDMKKGVIGLFGSLVSFAGISLGDIESIVSIVCGIVGLLITIVGVVIIPVWKKIRDAKKDGVITPEELEDINNTLKEGIDKINPDNKKGDK